MATKKGVFGSDRSHGPISHLGLVFGFETRYCNTYLCILFF